MSKDTLAGAELAHFSFQIQNRALAPFTHLKLFNGYNEVVGKCYGDLEIDIPKGLYQLRIEMNDFVEDRNYRVEAGSQISDYIVDFKLNSAIPVSSFSSTHEYFSGPADEWSRKSTLSGNAVSGSSLFLFLSYSEKDKPFDERLLKAENLSLLAANRELMYTFTAERIQYHSGKNYAEDVFFASICFNDELSPGQYYLVYDGESVKRELPVYIYPNWQTQVFIRFRDLPLFSSLRISLSRNGFFRDNPDMVQLDAIISKMHNGLYVLPDELRTAAAYGKWENPMLGILACYMYLLTNDTDEDELFVTMLNNLENMILNTHDSPDIVALRLLGAVHFNTTIPQEPLTAPCMVAAGLNAFLKQSMVHPHLIPAGGLVEKIFPVLAKESIFTMYEPIVQPLPKPKGKIDINLKTIAKGISIIDKLTNSIHAKILESAVNEVASKKDQSPVSSGLDLANDWVSSSIITQLSQVAGDPDRVDIVALAQQLQVTTNTVKETLGMLKGKNVLKEVATAVLDQVDKKELKQAIAGINSKIDNMLE